MSVDARMRLERPNLRYRYDRIEIPANPVLRQMGEKLRLTVGQGHQPVAGTQTLQCRHHIAKGLQLLPVAHKILHFVGRGVHAVVSQYIDQSTACHFLVTAVPQSHYIVLVLFDPLSDPPLSPKHLRIQIRTSLF